MERLSFPRSMVAVLCTLALLSLTACGGGDSDEDDDGATGCNPPCAQGKICDTSTNPPRCVDNTGGGQCDPACPQGQTCDTSSNPPECVDGGNPGGGACPEISNCSLECDGDAQCIQQCKQGKSQQAKDNFDQLNSCVENSNCNSVSCYCQSCTSETKSCGVHTNYCKGKSCGEVYQCIINCDSESCNQNCLSAQNSTLTGRLRFAAYNKCIKNNCQNAQDPNACACNKCLKELKACDNINQQICQ